MSLVLNADTGVNLIQDNTVTSAKVANGSLILNVDGDTPLFNGSFRPVVSAEVNTTVTSVYSKYIRVGNMVMVAGQFVLDPTATGAVSFELSLPIASNFSSTSQAFIVVSASGSISSSITSGEGYSQSTNKTLGIRVWANISSAFTCKYSGIYELV